MKLINKNHRTAKIKCYEALLPFSELPSHLPTFNLLTMEKKMPKAINRRQKPLWKTIRKPIPPATKPHGTKKGKKGYDREEWKRGIREEGNR
ncbi:MAG: hypothetical protein QME42_02655 [bacterium]|nr:hypothetical protein [bacterium]